MGTRFCCLNEGWWVCIKRRSNARTTADPPFGFAQGRLFGDDNQNGKSKKTTGQGDYRSGFGVEVGAEEAALDEHAEDVLEGEVGFLDVHGDGGGDLDGVVAE
jgi:hypothetical protein